MKKISQKLTGLPKTASLSQGQAVCKECGKSLTMNELKRHKRGQPSPEFCTACQLRKLGWVDYK